MFDTLLFRPGRGGVPIAAAVVALLSWPTLTVAQVSQTVEPTVEIPDWEWPILVEAPLRNFFEREDVEAILVELPRPGIDGTSNIATLAATLGPGIEESFRFVQRRVAYEAYAGSVRGGAGALRARGGNALDQALLLRDLLRTSGHRARLARGRLGWQQAVLLTGDNRTESPGRGDPWLRQVETASDHWWVEVRDRGSWRAADPSFSGTTLGDEMVRRADTVDRLPPRLVATVRLELTVGGRQLGVMEVPLPDLFGHSVQVGLARLPDPEHESALDPLLVGETGQAGDPVEGPPASDLDATEAIEAELEAEPDPLDRAPIEAVLQGIPEGPVSLEIRAAGKVVVALPVPRARLGAVRLGVDIEVPPGRHVRAMLPFGADPAAQLTVSIAGGEVRPSVYATQLVELHGALQQLLELEVSALEAWRLRPPGDDAEEALAEEGALGPEPPTAADLDPTEEVEPLVHPAIALHVGAVEAWEAFADGGVEAIGLALLAAADQLRAPVPIQRAAVRLAAIHYRPATAEVGGELTAWIADPARVGGPADNQRVATQMALGLLQSAIAGQVLNRLAGRPPDTAYDVTLRAVGSGSRLSWFSLGAPAPQWPAAAIQVARADLNSGNTVVGPARPIRRGENDLLAWWSIAPGSGQASGRVQRPLGAAQAAVLIGPPVARRSLDSILASLHDLHVAGTWLLALGDPDRDALRALVPGACAATPLVADLLRAGAPADFVPPAFGAFCQMAGAS